jgi:GTP-binding protein
MGCGALSFSSGMDSAEDELEAGRKLFAQECRFVIGAARLDQLPSPDRNEIAFAGRSNVGKSSLLNALTNRKGLARVSQTPGLTQQINIFDLGGRCYLADLPGYGYARAAKSAVKSWTRLVHLYLRGRPNLRRLCLLIDARHGIGEPDREIMRLLDEAAVAHQLVLTKADKLPAAALASAQAAAAGEAGRGACHPDVLVTSAETGAGIAALRAALASLIERR